MWFFGRFGTVCTILKTWWTPREEYYFYQSCKLKPATLPKVTLLHWCFSRFLNCANGIKLRKASNMYVVLDKYKCYGCEAGYYCLGDGNEVNCTTVNKHYFSFGMASSCSKCPEGWVSFLFYKIKTFQNQVPKDNFNFMWTTNQNGTLAKHLYDVDGVSICSFSRKSLSIG